MVHGKRFGPLDFEQELGIDPVVVTSYVFLHGADVIQV